jgi:hypothetical protein
MIARAAKEPRAVTKAGSIDASLFLPEEFVR